MTRAPTHLKQRKKGWYVQLAVPTKFQPAMGGKKVLVKSLGTRDEVEALRLRHPVITAMQMQMAEALAAAEGRTPPELTPEVILQYARTVRRAIDDGEQSERDAHPAFEALMDDFSERKARSVGVDHDGHPRLPQADVETIRRAHGVLYGNPSLTLGYQAERYIGQLEGTDLRRQTLADKRRHLDSFLDWIGRETECKRVTKARASAYFSEVILPRDLAVQTRRVGLNVVRQFFDWMEGGGVVASNPFDKVGKFFKESKRGRELARRPWTGEELLKVLGHVPQSDPMWPLVALGAFTGARREDLCSLRAQDAVDGVLIIRQGKTAAAVRRIPVHAVVRSMVDQLVEASSDGYLLPGLLTGGSDDKRGHYIGKRFSYAKAKAGVTDPRVVFHSFRNSVLTQMEAAGVPLRVRQQIVGHERAGVTERYTNPADDARLAEAIAHVTYGQEVDRYIRETGAALNISHVSRRRKHVPVR